MGSLALAQGNQYRLEMRSAPGQGANDAHVSFSDGKKMYGGPFTPVQDVPPQLTQGLQAAFGRAGLMFMSLALTAGQYKDFKIDQTFAISEFKLGEKEAIGGRQVQAVQYKLVLNGPEVPVAEKQLAITLWIDPKTELPVKRVVKPWGKELSFVLTETYGEFVLDEKIDPQKFVLPK